MEKELRSVVCPDHNLRYDPAQSNGCARCQRMLGTMTSSGRTAVPGAASKSSKSGSKLVPTIVFAASLFFGWLLTHTTHEKAPEGAFVDPDGRFALVVPKRWKSVDPATVTYLPKSFSEGEGQSVATLISDRGKLAPTVLIDVTEGSPGPASNSEMPKFEEAFREGWGDTGKLEMKTELTTVDRIRSFRAAMVAEVNRQHLTMEHYFIPGRSHSYLITALVLGNKPDETAAAARLMADGFRVLERPPLVRGIVQKVLLGVLAVALIGSIRKLAS